MRAPRSEIFEIFLSFTPFEKLLPLLDRIDHCCIDRLTFLSLSFFFIPPFPLFFEEKVRGDTSDRKKSRRNRRDKILSLFLSPSLIRSLSTKRRIVI